MTQPKKLLCILVSAVVIASSFAFAGCSSNNAQKLQAVNANYDSRPINFPSIVARDKDLFGEEFAKDGITFTWHDLTLPSNQLEALAAKSLDFANSLNYVSVILAKASGNDITVISAYSRFPQGISLVVRTDASIDALADLRGKKMALTKGTMLHEMLIRALAAEQMTEQDLELVNLNAADASAALIAGQIDAAILPEPILFKTLATGKIKELCSAEGLIPGLTVIVVRSDFAKTWPEAVKRYLQVHKASLDWIRENLTEAFEMAAKENQMESQVVQALYPKFNFDMSLENVKDDLLKSAVFLQNEGMIRPEINLEKLVDELLDPAFLPK